jgi:hypothetical protein
MQLRNALMWVALLFVVSTNSYLAAQIDHSSNEHVAIELQVVPGMDFAHPAYRVTVLDDGLVSFSDFRRGQKREIRKQIRQEEVGQLLKFIEDKGFFAFRGFGEGDAMDAAYSRVFVHTPSRERLVRVFDFEKNVPQAFDDIQREILHVTKTKSLAGRHAIPKRPKNAEN